MSIGTGVFLFVVGAILSFALNIQVAWADLHLVGYILMAAGAVVFVIGLVLATRRRSATATSRSTIDPVSGDRTTIRRTDSDDPQV